MRCTLKMPSSVLAALVMTWRTAAAPAAGCRGRRGPAGLACRILLLCGGGVGILRDDGPRPANHERDGPGQTQDPRHGRAITKHVLSSEIGWQII